MTKAAASRVHDPMKAGLHFEAANELSKHEHGGRLGEVRERMTALETALGALVG